MAKASSFSAARNDSHVETVRGIACLLIILYHIINANKTGIVVADDNPLLVISSLLSPVRLPLFTFISGYVYAIRPVVPGKQASFLLGKFRRLLLPLISVGGLFLLAQNLFEGSQGHLPLQDGWQILIFPYAHFWYLQALTLIFIVIAALEAMRLIERSDHWIAIFALCIALRLFFVTPVALFSISGAITLMPFFMLGIGFRRFPELFRAISIRVVGLIAVTGLLLYYFHLTNVISVPHAGIALLQLAIGIAACVFLLSVKFSWLPLALVGKFSYSIYLFHIFGTAGSRVILTNAGIENTTILFVAAFLAGIFLPIAIELVADGFSFARLVFLGRNPHTRPSGPPMSAKQWKSG